MTELELKTVYAGSLPVVCCAGRLVFGETCARLERHAKVLLESYPVIALDLRGIRALDSAGLGMLIKLLTSARRSQGDVKLIAPSAKASEVLKVTKLDLIFESAQSAEELLAGSQRVLAASA
jgi:Anti-anti-sigma regulatory factor (antagonist of anti-sigma factor)